MFSACPVPCWHALCGQGYARAARLGLLYHPLEQCHLWWGLHNSFNPDLWWALWSQADKSLQSAKQQNVLELTPFLSRSSSGFVYAVRALIRNWLDNYVMHICIGPCFREVLERITFLMHSFHREVQHFIHTHIHTADGSYIISKTSASWEFNRICSTDYCAHVICISQRR